jgi:hypothetical protein
MVWLEIAASSAAQERKDGWRDKDPALDPERDWKSDRSGMLSMGGRYVVECRPDMAEPECVLVLAIDRIVHIEPVGDCFRPIGHCDGAIKDLPKHIMS